MILIIDYIVSLQLHLLLVSVCYKKPKFIDNKNDFTALFCLDNSRLTSNYIIV